MIIDAFAMRRKEKVKGRTIIEELMVSESFKVRMFKNYVDGRKLAT